MRKESQYFGPILAFPASPAAHAIIGNDGRLIIADGVVNFVTVGDEVLDVSNHVTIARLRDPMRCEDFVETVRPQTYTPDKPAYSALRSPARGCQVFHAEFAGLLESLAKVGVIATISMAFVQSVVITGGFEERSEWH